MPERNIAAARTSLQNAITQFQQTTYGDSLEVSAWRLRSLTEVASGTVLPPRRLVAMEPALSVTRLRPSTRLLATLLLVCGMCGCLLTTERESRADHRSDHRADDQTILVRAQNVAPEGWRRTRHGWERLEQSADVTINHWIRVGVAEESRNRWLVFVQSLAVVHPISIGAAQLSVVCLIAAAARNQKRTHSA